VVLSVIAIDMRGGPADRTRPIPKIPSIREGISVGIMGPTSIERDETALDGVVGVTETSRGSAVAALGNAIKRARAAGEGKDQADAQKCAAKP